MERKYKKALKKLQDGGSITFTPGLQWEIVKDFKGPSHAGGGIDISVQNGNVKKQ